MKPVAIDPEKIKTGYFKLVRTSDSKKRSAFIAPPNSIHYAKGEWTLPRPRCGPAAVFADLSSLRHFLATNSISWLDVRLNFLVYRCSIIPHKGRRGLWLGRHQMPASDLPVGTVLAAAVRLDQHIPWEEVSDDYS